LHVFLKRVVRGDGQLARVIDLRHLPHEIQTVIRVPLQDLELPLVDHLVGESIQKFLLRVRRADGEPLQQREGEANLATSSVVDGGLWRTWPALTGEQTD
jgi:hypothetical protein